MRTRVKICGITRPEDGEAASTLGADAIGLVFYEKSPRCVSIARAREIIAALKPFVSVVGLFVDPGREQVETVLTHLAIDLLQFHGDECPADCGGYGRPYVKAVRMRPGVHVSGYAAAYKDASGFLLDTYIAGVPGGTGQPFDWSQVPRGLGKPIILAGGLNPTNVGQAIAKANPYAVDVSGGVEREKGIKDPRKIAAFLRGVNHVERTQS